MSWSWGLMRDLESSLTGYLRSLSWAIQRSFPTADLYLWWMTLSHWTFWSSGRTWSFAESGRNFRELNVLLRQRRVWKFAERGRTTTSSLGCEWQPAQTPSAHGNLVCDLYEGLCCTWVSASLQVVLWRLVARRHPNPWNNTLSSNIQLKNATKHPPNPLLCSVDFLTDRLDSILTPRTKRQVKCSFTRRSRSHGNTWLSVRLLLRMDMPSDGRITAGHFNLPPLLRKWLQGCSDGGWNVGCDSSVLSLFCALPYAWTLTSSFALSSRWSFSLPPYRAKHAYGQKLTPRIIVLSLHFRPGCVVFKTHLFEAFWFFQCAALIRVIATPAASLHTWGSLKTTL